jgi:hypothetical protein
MISTRNERTIESPGVAPLRSASPRSAPLSRALRRGQSWGQLCPATRGASSNGCARIACTPNNPTDSWYRVRGRCEQTGHPVPIRSLECMARGARRYMGGSLRSPPSAAYQPPRAAMCPYVWSGVEHLTGLGLNQCAYVAVAVVV